MKNIQKLTVIFLFLALIVCISPIYASSNNNLEANDITAFTKDTIENISGFEFKIPMGYGPVSEMDEVAQADSLTISNLLDKSNVHYYMNNNNDLIIISVDNSKTTVDDYNTLTHSDTSNKTSINGNTGYIESNNEEIDFTFMKDKQVITITAPTVDDINDIIV